LAANVRHDNRVHLIAPLPSLIHCSQVPRLEQQREFEAEPLTLPPDIHEYQTRTPPAKIGDETHQPGGELHAVSSKEEPPSELPEPPLDGEAGDDELGDLPEELRDLPDPVPEPRGTVVPQPVSVSLTEE
jgi:hypothetical protein